MQRPIALFALFCASQATPLLAQTSAPTLVPFGGTPDKPVLISPLTQPTITQGMITLLQLEERFSKAVETGGGRAFASWFTDDAVTLNNGQPAVLGRGSIAENATWDAKDYQLTWQVQGARMGPSNDMGFTWGHYEGRSKDKHGEPLVISGRYMTVWRKLPDGTWKVALDASASEPAASSDCCALPKP